VGALDQQIRCLPVRILFIIIKDNNCSQIVCVGHMRFKENEKLGPQVSLSHERRMTHINWPSLYKTQLEMEVNQIN